MKAKYVFLFCLVNCVISVVYGEIDYKPTGPDQTVAFEKALLEASPGCVDGIFPRQEILNTGIPKNKILPRWIQMIETWLSKVLCPNYSPKPKTEITMYGLPELRWKSDYIVGYYLIIPEDSNELTSRVEFQATDRDLSITIFMVEKITDVNALSDDTVLQILEKYMAVPEDKLPKISIEKTHKVLAGVPVCYGKMRCEFHERRDIGPDKDKKRRWWSYMFFWITEDKFYISVSTIDWEKNGCPVAANSILFGKDTGKDLKGLPTDTKKK